jgi:predicted nucleic acid-binding protein
MVIAEIEFGMAKATSANPEQREALHRFFADYPLHLPVDDNTVEPYALIRAQVWHNHATPKGRRHKEKLPEELTDRVTGKSLGIDERDLLIAATATQYGLTLITNDSNEVLRRIEKAAQDLEVAGKPIRLRIDRWPQNP